MILSGGATLCCEGRRSQALRPPFGIPQIDPSMAHGVPWVCLNLLESQVGAFQDLTRQGATPENQKERKTNMLLKGILSRSFGAFFDHLFVLFWFGFGGSPSRLRLGLVS